MPAPPVGSLVVPAPEFRETMQTGEGAALMLSHQRGSAEIFYPGTQRTFWVPLDKIREVPQEAVAQGCLEDLLSAVIKDLETEECVMDPGEDGAILLTLGIPRLAQESLARLQATLGETLQLFLVEPGNMHRISLRLLLVNLPQAHEAGT